MQVQSQIQVDLNRPGEGSVPVMQYDGNTRSIAIALYADGTPWQPPEGVTAALGYEKPDHTRGLYDKLADGSAAISIDGNVVTVLLARQVLTAAGTVFACLVFYDEQRNQLSTFPFRLLVQVNPAVEAPESEDYNRLQWLEDQLETYLRQAKESGEFTGPIGPGPVLLGQEVAFQVSSDYRTIPTGVWQAQVPPVAPKTYVWSRTTAHYDSGDVVTYSVSRNGANGDGAVNTVCGVSPDDAGNIPLSASDVGALACVGGSVQGEIHMNGQKITDLPAPEADGDAANKAFVAEQAAAAAASTQQALKTKVVSFLLSAASWVGDSAPYTQFIAITGLEDDHRLRAYPVYGSDQEKNLAMKEACAAVSFAMRGEGGITFTCLEEKPAASISVSVEIYR